jgi:hypothetical protein
MIPPRLRIRQRSIAASSRALAAAGCLLAPALAQATWRQQFPSPHPSPRVGHGMVYDASAQRVLLFGGSNGPGSVRYDDTWEWNGSSWSQRTAMQSPSPRNHHAMAYDVARGRAVVFGGLTGAVVNLADTWEWDGATWTQRFPAHAPAARIQAAVAYDAARGRVVLFGGAAWGSPVPFGDTWEWDGVDWTQRATAVEPPGSEAAVMAYDAGRAVCVLYVPVLVGGVPTGAQTWEWDGVAWTQRLPATTPSVRRVASMAYDPVRQRTVLFGGFYDGFAAFYDETWEWDGSNWSLQTLLPHPAGRSSSAMAFDAARGEIVLFGGALYFGANEASDTWVHGVPNGLASYSGYGAGCSGWAGTPWLASASRPIVGQSFSVNLYNLPADHSVLLGIGLSNTDWLGMPLPLDLAPLGAPGCRVLASADVTLPLFNWAGQASWTWAVPNQGSLVGVAFYCQAAAVDHSNALGLVFTGGGRGVIGTH